MFMVTRKYSTTEKHFCQPLFMVRALKCRRVCGMVVNTEYRTGFLKILTTPPVPICRMCHLVPFEDFYVRIIRVRRGGEVGASLSHLNGAKDNPHSYMVQGESKKPSGETVRYAGGNGPLENITITGNTFTPRNKTLPVVYVGAEVSKAQNGRQEVRGDIKGVNVSGNTVKGVKGNDYSELLVTHEGSLDKLGPATISFTDKSVVAQ